jgi:hypothetical protein
MKIQSFDGGLSIKRKPQFLSLNQGVVYDNIDNDLGSLAPVKDSVDTGIEVKPYFTYFDAVGAWVDSSVEQHYLEYKGTLYSSDGVNRPTKFDGQEYNYLGIEPPVNSTKYEARVAPESPKEFSTSVVTASTGGLPRAVYSYLLITDLNERSKATYLQVESDNTVNTLGEDIQYLPTPSAIVKDPGTDQQVITFSGYTDETRPAKVYRYYNRAWHLVGSLTKGGSLTDTSLDISINEELKEGDLPGLTGTVSYVWTYYNSSDGTESGPSFVSNEIALGDSFGSVYMSLIPVSDDPQVSHKRLYRVGGNLARFTLVAELPNSTTTYLDNVADANSLTTTLPESNAAPAPVGLKHLAQAYAMLFGSVGDKLRFTPIGKPDSWPETYFLDYDYEITGLAPVANGLLVFTASKTYIVTGTSPTTLSSYPLSGDQGCLSYKSIRLIGTDAVWVSSDGVCRSSGNRPTVVTKELLGKVSIEAKDSAVYDESYYVLTEDNKLYCVGEGIVRTLDLGIDGLSTAKNKLYGRASGTLRELFASNDNLTFKYKSPIITEGSFTVEKIYKKLFIYASGYVKINIHINGLLVVTKELEGENSHVVLIPSEYQRGNYLQYELEGTGEVSEIEYTVAEQQKR